LRKGKFNSFSAGVTGERQKNNYIEALLRGQRRGGAFTETRKRMMKKDAPRGPGTYYQRVLLEKSGSRLISYIYKQREKGKDPMIH